MKQLRLTVDGISCKLSRPVLRMNSSTLVPVDEFARAIGAEVVGPGSGASAGEPFPGEADVGNQAGGPGAVALCRYERCVPIDADSIVDVDGRMYADLTAFGGALGLRWRVGEEVCHVNTDDQHTTGIRVGQNAPVFTLPDMRTGEPVSSNVVLGRKAAFFMWASW